MHEVSIALGIVDELKRIARENNAIKITLVKLKIGKMSGIVTDSLKFAFDVIKNEHPIMASAEILIHEIPLVYQCNECSTTFETGDVYFTACTHCSADNVKIISGEEQHIENVEMEV